MSELRPCLCPGNRDTCKYLDRRGGEMCHIDDHVDYCNHPAITSPAAMGREDAEKALKDYDLAKAQMVKLGLDLLDMNHPEFVKAYEKVEILKSKLLSTLTVQPDVEGLVKAAKGAARLLLDSPDQFDRATGKRLDTELAKFKEVKP